MLVKIKLTSSTSFRAATICGSIMKESFNISTKIPSYTTLLNWVHKIGYYELNKPKEIADDWVIILDESIQLGNDKVLVIFGIRESKIDFSRPLRFQDLTPLRQISKSKWTGEIIKEELSSLEKEIGTISYAVGDYGNNIRKALKMMNILHVHDITHKVALIIKKIFKDNIEYNTIIENMSEMRVRLAQSDIAFIIPPKQGKKSRYHNINSVSKWCTKALKSLDKEHDKIEKIKDNFNWILPHEKFINEFNEVNKVICDVEKIIKHNGLCKTTINQCNFILNEITSDIGKKLKEELQIYFNDTIEMFAAQKKKNILATSDIIESSFGKYKNYISCNPMAGITNLVLCIAAFTSSLTNESIKEALESTMIKDIDDWSEKFIGETLYKKRKEFLYAA